MLLPAYPKSQSRFARKYCSTVGKSVSILSKQNDIKYGDQIIKAVGSNHDFVGDKLITLTATQGNTKLS